MTEKDERTPNNLSDETTDNSNINTDDLDIEGALAALSSLQDLTREDEPEEVTDTEPDLPDDDSEADDDISEDRVEDEASLEISPFERVDDDADDLIDTEDELALDDAYLSDLDSAPDTDVTDETFVTAFPHPPISVLHRGQLASIVPALLLMGIGGYLTFLVTTTDATLQLPVIIAVAIGGLGAMLLAQWISSSRWSIGSFFIGVLLLLTGGTIAYLVLPNQLSLIDGYPLIITAIGTAFVITDVFVPSGRRIWLIGLILAITGLAGVFVTITLVNLELVESLSGFLPIALIIVLALLIAPFVSRRQ